MNTAPILSNYIFHILFKIMRPIRRNYGVATNVLIVLNSCYLYSFNVRDQFTRTDIYKFTRYYSMGKLQGYMTVLTLKGLIEVSEQTVNYKKFRLTDKGLKLVSLINDNYNTELSLFLSLYNISL